MTRNEHLLQAYKNLGVKGRMQEVLRHATWCDPRVAQDHLDIVSAFEAGDRDAARRLICEHADRSKQTMRRAIDQSRTRVLPKWYSRGRFDGKTVMVTGAAQGIGQTVATRIAAEGGDGGPRRPVGTGLLGRPRHSKPQGATPPRSPRIWKPGKEPQRRPSGCARNWAESTC